MKKLNLLFQKLLLIVVFSIAQSLFAQQPVLWKKIIGGIAYGNTFYKTAPTAWDNCGISSVNTLAAGTDGYVETTAYETNTTKMLGLSQTDTNILYTSINFALDLSQDSKLYVHENGIIKYNPSNTTYAIGDVLRIERVGNKILYKKNGVTFYTSTQNSTSALVVDCFLRTTGSYLSNVVASFGTIASAASVSPQAWIVSNDKVSYSSGNVGIGTSNPDAKLTVAGNIKAREVEVKITAGADFVFEENYNLPKLSEVEAFVKTNKHLPGIQSERDMQENGLNLNEMNIRLLQKVEELTLYVIEQQKQIEVLIAIQKKSKTNK